MTPSLRKPAGVLLLLFGLVVYALVVSAFAPWLGALPKLAAIPVYIVLGLLWIPPVGPLLRWMETGRWTAPK